MAVVPAPSYAPDARGTLPKPRGALTAQLRSVLLRPPHEFAPLPDASDYEDETLALYVLYEIHYRGFAGVDDRWEWEPSLLRERARLERVFEGEVHDKAGAVSVSPARVAAELGVLASQDGVSLSRWVAEFATLDNLREFAIHRSAYQLKEADPHSWAIPRLTGSAKAALVDIQTGEYGDGDAARVHATLFADTMRALDLNSAYAAYLDVIPAVTLATVNLMSFFGLHRRWRGALVGHLALFEMCSVTPMRRYAATLRRLGVPAGAPFYDVHVDADARHAIVAQRDLAAGLAREEPALASDILFGARALDVFEREFAQHLIRSWSSEQSSLRTC